MDAGHTTPTASEKGPGPFTATGAPIIFSRRRFGIAPRLLAFILLFSSLVTVVSTGFQLFFDYRRDLGAIESRLDQIEGSYLGSLAHSLWDMDTDQLKTQLDGMLRLPDMQALEIRETADVARPLVMSVGQRKDHAVINRVIPINYSDGGKSRQIGVLSVQCTLTGVYQRLLNTVTVILLTQAVKTFLVSLFILYIFFHLVTRHLTFIANYVDRYDLLNPTPLALQRRKPTWPDELDRMISAFNKMSAGLATAYGKVREANALLEHDLMIRRGYEERLQHQAHHDDLTGLPNRALMLDRLNQAIAGAHRERAFTALLFIDLDHFKDVNDALGHAVGDELLKEAAVRLRVCLREQDTLARMGGDEFIVILPNVDDYDVVQRVAERVVEAFVPPFVLQQQEHYVTASIGITLYPTDGVDAPELLRNADLAMYRAKEVGRNGYYFFTQEINQRMQERLALEGRLRGAVSRGELQLHYQPIIDLARNQPVALEALIRWWQPDDRVIMPGVFIPIAEEMGLIGGVGDWVLATACAELRDLLTGPLPVHRLAINVSPKQLQMSGFGAVVERMLAESGLPPESLELEITEGVLMDDMPEIAANLKMLCDLGVRLSIDDFGTGYSSLGYLQRYPFDSLKIDRSFVSEAMTSASAARLVETIITMAHGLGLEVIAEGVETAEQLAFLRGRQCNHAQGYFFSKPVPLKELMRKLENLGR
jgi:diguanylate cyclase (GGDEF)-like protein